MDSDWNKVIKGESRRILSNFKGNFDSPDAILSNYVFQRQRGDT